MLLAFGGGEAIAIFLEQPGGGEGNGKRGAKFVGNVGNEAGFEFAQFFFVANGVEQLDFRLFVVADVGEVADDFDGLSLAIAHNFEPITNPALLAVGELNAVFVVAVGAIALGGWVQVGKGLICGHD